MTTSIPLSDLESSPSAKFTSIGDGYKGRIVSMDQRQNTKPSGELAFFPSGAPQMVWIITIEQANGEHVALWANGGKYEVASGTGESMLAAIGTAVRNAGAAAVEVGAELAVAHTGMGKPTSPGKNAPRLYTAQYKAAAASVPLDLFSGGNP